MVCTCTRVWCTKCKSIINLWQNFSLCKTCENRFGARKWMDDITKMKRKTKWKSGGNLNQRKMVLVTEISLAWNCQFWLSVMRQTLSFLGFCHFDCSYFFSFFVTMPVCVVNDKNSAHRWFNAVKIDCQRRTNRKTLKNETKPKENRPWDQYPDDNDSSRNASQTNVSIKYQLDREYNAIKKRKHWMYRSTLSIK